MRIAFVATPMRNYITENVRRVRAIEAKVKAIRMDFRTICRGEDRLESDALLANEPCMLGLSALANSA